MYIIPLFIDVVNFKFPIPRLTPAAKEALPILGVLHPLFAGVPIAETCYGPWPPS